MAAYDLEITHVLDDAWDDYDVDELVGTFLQICRETPHRREELGAKAREAWTRMAELFREKGWIAEDAPPKGLGASRGAIGRALLTDAELTLSEFLESHGIGLIDLTWRLMENRDPQQTGWLRDRTIPS